MKKLYQLSFICLIICITCLVGFNTGETAMVYAAGNADFYNSNYEPDFASYQEMTNNVILLAFNDELDYLQSNAFDTFTENLESKLNTDEKSLYNYYLAMSNGRFSLTSNILKDGEDYFIVRLPEDRGHYLPYSSSNTHGYVSTQENNIRYELLQEVRNQVNDAGIDLVNGDVNLDGETDIITLVYLNEGEYRDVINKANDGFLWPHQATYYSSLGKLDELDFYSYIMLGSERFEGTGGISTLSHEIGHILGLPDLYEIFGNPTQDLEYGESPDGLYAVGDWDNMAYNKIQYLTTFDRYMLGWLDDDEFVELTYDGDFSIAPVSRNESRVLAGQTAESYPLGYYLRDPEYPDQLICFEYRDNENSIFDSALSESGLLVYRVDLNTVASNGYDLNRFVGNFYSNGPYTVFMFRKSGSVYTAALNGGESLGSSEGELYADVTQNANDYITYQVYNNELKLNEQVINDVTYVNSGIVISNVTISGGRANFEIDSPLLESDIALTSADIPDARLRTALYSKVGKATTDELFRGDFADIETLDLAGIGVNNLKGLELLDFSSLHTLILSNNNIFYNLDVIGNITSLVNLQLFNCRISNIDFVSGLTKLEYLNVSANYIEDFSALRNLPVLKKALLVLNDYDFTLAGNEFIKNPTQTKYILGIQNMVSEVLISAGYVYYLGYNLDGNISLSVKKDGSDYAFEYYGTHSLPSGTYQLSFSINSSMIEHFGVYGGSIVVKVYNVAVKTPQVLLRKSRDTYVQDTQDSLSGFVGTGLTLVISTVYEDGTPQVGSLVDVDVPGDYKIIFTITYGQTSVNLYKYVTVIDDEPIECGPNGIPDVNLYKELLNAVGKNRDMIGQGEMGTLYQYDVLFYNINNPDNPLTTLNFRKKNIESLQGLPYFSLQYITKIVLNSNKITDLSPLFNNNTLIDLEELHVADNKLETIEGIEALKNLKVLDLSYNYLTDVSPLKALTAIDVLQEAQKEQKLRKVNVMFNLLDLMDDKNSFIMDSTIADGYLSCNQIYIILVQGIKDGDIYINASKFQYYDTLANRYNDGQKDLPIYTVKVNSANNKFSGFSNLITNSALISGKKYTLSVATNKRVYDLQINESDSRFERYCYVINATLNDLQPNVNAGTNSLLLIEDKPNTILTTETIMLPDIADIKLGAVSGLTFVYDLNCAYLINDADKTFVNGEVGTYQIEYTIVVKNALDGVTQTDEVKLLRTITVEENGRVGLYEKTSTTDITTFSGFLDENLFNKLCNILKIEPRYMDNDPDRPFLYQYDTYNLTDLNLSESNITYINGLVQMKLPKLKYLRLNKNNIVSLYTLENSNTLKNLVVMDISENMIVDSTPLKKFTSTEDVFYINACVNQFDLMLPINTWLIYESTTNVKILVGLQCLEKDSVAITFRNEINSASDGNAGFFYCTANMEDRGTLNAKDTYVDTYDVTSQYYAYNFYHYYKDAGLFNITFTYSFSYNYQQIANIQYSTSLRHGKVYQSVTSVDVDYEKENTQSTRDSITKQLDLVFEEIKATEYDITPNIQSFKLNVLATYTQTINVAYKENLVYQFIFTKSVIVKDREKPVIVFNGEPYLVVLKGLGNGYDYRSNGVGKGENSEVYVKDNYTAPVTIIVTVYNSLGTEVRQVDINTPDTYTVKYNAKDSYNNVADEVTRTVKVIYNDYASGVRLNEPDAEFMVGEVELSASIMVFEDEEDLVNPIPTFYWFIDGKYVGESKSFQTLDESSILRTTFKCKITEAGKHEITLRVNNKDGSLDEENAMAYTTTIFVLLDNNVINIIVITILCLIALTGIIVWIIFALKRRRERKLNTYDYNILKETNDDSERTSRSQK